MELIEQDGVYSELRKVRDEVAAGRGRIVLVCGEAGIGKTALVEQFAQAQPPDWRVLWGACDALFTPRPLGPLYDIARQARGDLAALLQGEIDRVALFSACLAELQTPTLLILEDIHWADEATLDLLKYLGRRIGQTGSLLVATYRDDELGPRHPLRLLLGDLVRSSTTQRLRLSPLSVDGVRRLIGGRRLDADDLHKQTGGNPFFVTEILASAGSAIPATIRDAVLARAARLSLSERAVLNAAAVIGPRIEPWLLAAVVQAEASAVDESLALGMLVVQGEWLSFRHELARQTILDTIPPHQRIFLHQAVLDVLRASPLGKQDVTRLAHHAQGAQDHDAILAYAPIAAREAAALGMHRAAASLFRLALDHADDLPLLQQIELNEGYALSMQGDPSRTETIAAYRRAAALAQRAELPRRHGFELVRLAGVLDIVGRREDANQRLDEALSILEPHAPNRGLIDAYRLLAMNHLSQGDAATALEHALKGYQMALDTEQVHVIISAQQIVGLCWLPLDHQRGCEHLEASLALSLENQQYWAAAALYPNLIMSYVDVFQLSRAEELLESALPYAIDHDMDGVILYLQAWQAMLQLFQGHWLESRATAESVLDRAALQPGTGNVAQAALGRLLARQGESERARALLDEALAQSKQIGNRQRMGVYYSACAEAAWLAGDRAEVLSISDIFYETAVQNRQPGFAAELAYWRWCAGAPVETHDWMVRAYALEIQGDWRGAAAAWAALGCPYEEARALAGGDAEAQLAALATLESLGARPLIDVVRERLRSAGMQTIPRGPRPTTRENPFNLTNRQMEILGLLTEDLTNAEIADRLTISAKTVDHHVSAILAKLNVPSRVAAADVARQHPSFQ